MSSIYTGLMGSPSVETAELNMSRINNAPQRKMKSFPLAVLLVLGGCMGNLLIPSHTSEVGYKKAVRLHDGRIIVVERHVERKGRAVPGSPPMQSWEEIRTKNPDTDEEIVWQENAASGAHVLDFKSEPYLAVSAGLHSS